MAFAVTPALHRESAWEKVQQRTKPWDVLVIGGGATGIGIALDAASRGLECLLLEQADFGKGTSSRSTKLVHGGVRYLRQGNLRLVRDALYERTLLRKNAPHLVHDIRFLIPGQNCWQRFYYGAGLKLYDRLAGSNNFGRSQSVSAALAQQLVPTLRSDRHRGGVVFHDGQFDDARLLINMARTAVDQGACLLNYAEVCGLLKNDQAKIRGVEIRNRETEQTAVAEACAVINATGPFCDTIRRMDDEACTPLVAASQGVHLVLTRQFFPGSVAMIIPKTSDGRLLFVIPWHDRVLVGTTDTPLAQVALEPTAQANEIQFLLDAAAEYLTQPPTIRDVRSIFTGIRPLVRGDKSTRTASLARDHFIKRSASGLITITGGKWTTVRKMSEDCVDRAVRWAKLAADRCRTENLQLHGHLDAEALAALATKPRGYYGADLARIERLERDLSLNRVQLHPLLTLCESDVIWSTRYEMARTVEDVLARRTRCLFLDATAALAVAPRVAEIMARELMRDQAWQRMQLESFSETARHYVPPAG